MSEEHSSVRSLASLNLFRKSWSDSLTVISTPSREAMLFFILLLVVNYWINSWHSCRKEWIDPLGRHCTRFLLFSLKSWRRLCKWYHQWYFEDASWHGSWKCSQMVPMCHHIHFPCLEIWTWISSVRWSWKVAWGPRGRSMNSRGLFFDGFFIISVTFSWWLLRHFKWCELSCIPCPPRGLVDAFVGI